MSEKVKVGATAMFETPRRLALVTNDSLYDPGGQAISIKNMLGFPAEWTLVSPFPHETDLQGIHIIQTERDLVIPRLKQHVVSPLERRSINRQLREQDPQAIIIDGRATYPLSFYAGLAPDLKEKTYSVWRNVIGDPLGYAHESPSRRILRRVQRRLIGRFAKDVKANLAISEAVAQSLRNLGVPENKIIIVPDSIGNDFIPDDRMRDERLPYEERNRAKYLEEDELGILYAGRISPAKGIDLIAELYENLRKERKHVLQHDGSFKKVKITIAGPVLEEDKVYFASFQQRLEEIQEKTGHEFSSDSVHIEYIGNQSKEQLQKLYNAYDVFYMPSLSEGFGRTTVEAMMGGMTVIGRAQTVATNEIISSAPYPIGILVESAEAAARDILMMMQHPEQLAELKANAVMWGNNHYSMDNSRRRLFEALDK